MTQTEPQQDTDVIDSTQPSEAGQTKELGAGRSGQVFLIQTGRGEVARKVFFSSELAKVVHYLTSGAGNPYAWNEDACQAAYHRRQVMAVLVRYWFGDSLVVSQALGAGWDPQRRAGYLDTEFIKGRPVALHQPCSPRRDGEYDVQVQQIMQPLQQHLIECGADGLAWQAGKGNPVALDNFMLIADAGSDEVDGQQREARYRFGWIDLESGVPALFPLNPIALLTFYLPASFKFGRPLFDDVDTEKLAGYVEQHRGEIEAKTSAEDVTALNEHLEQLRQHQARWKQMPRVQRSITEQHQKGRISAEQAEYYRHHALRWRMRESRRLAWRSAAVIFLKLPGRVGRWFAKLDYRWFFQHVWNLTTSQQYRMQTARDYVGERIKDWEQRDQLSKDDAQRLRSEMADDRSSDYLMDFGVHVGVKSIILVFEVIGLPLLIVLGIIRPSTAGALIVFDGPITRGSYVLLRMLQAAVRLRPLPWVALLVSMIPLLGLLAYPAQTVYSAAGRQSLVARFIIYDTFSRIGARIPIYGGQDTRTEHFFNRLARRLVRVE